MDIVVEYFLLQLVLFIPFYLHWREVSKDVELIERFIIHLVVFPVWVIPFIVN